MSASASSSGHVVQSTSFLIQLLLHETHDVQDGLWQGAVNHADVRVVIGQRHGRGRELPAVGCWARDGFLCVVGAGVRSPGIALTVGAHGDPCRRHIEPLILINQHTITPIIPSPVSLQSPQTGILGYPILPSSLQLSLGYPIVLKDPQ